MIVIKRVKSKAFTLVFFIITISTFVFSYTYESPSYLFKFALRLSDNLLSKGLCACSECNTLVDEDPWFMERFNRSVPPLMSKKNSMLSEDTYRWWQWLQSEKQPANYSEVVQRLFQLIPGEERYMDSGPNRCRTCAVVGNSGNLKGSKYGPLIDSSDFIIRMNKGPTLGYEQDVGSRTTHHVMYPESAKNLHNDTSLVLIPYKTLDLQWIMSALTTGTIKYTYLPVVSKIEANKDKVLIYSPTFFKYVYESWLEGHGRYPSTGFLTLMFALHICDEVNVYGFGADQEGNWHHYWENNLLSGAFRHTGVHDGDYEYNITLLLANKNKIKMFKGR